MTVSDNPLNLPKIDTDAIPAVTGSTPDELAASLNSLKAMLAEVMSAVAPINEAVASCKAEAKSYEQKAREAYEKARAFEVQVYDVKRALRKIEKEAESGERKLQQALAAEAAEREFMRIQSEYDRAMQGFAYFGQAKKHQTDGAMRMAYNQKVILADTMGLGKTLTAQIAADLCDAKKILVVCPSPVMQTFINEVKQWSPHRGEILPIGGMPKAQREFALMIAKDLAQCVVIVNFEAWRRDKNLIQALIDCQFDTVIIDEAHNIKDLETIAFQGIKKICYAENLDEFDPRVVQYAGENNGFFARCSVRNIFPMTGTPILNKPQELFPLLHLVDPINFRREYDYLYDYCTQDYDGKWVFRPGGLDRLTKKIANRFVRRTRKSAGIVLPERTFQVHNLTLDPETHPKQYADAKALNEKAMILVDPEEGKAITPSIILELILRKRQVMTWPAGIVIKDRDGVPILKCETEESVKLDYILRPGHDLAPSGNKYPDPDGLLADIAGGEEKTLVFSQFKAPLHELKRRCDAAGIRAAVIDGDVPMDRRTDIQRRFNEVPFGDPESVDVILGNYRALGVGLTLNAATQTIIVDEEWNPGKRDQAYDRNYRLGQDKETTVHVLRVNGSVDIWMQSLMEKKEDMIDGFNENIAQHQSATDMMRKFLEEGDQF